MMNVQNIFQIMQNIKAVEGVQPVSSHEGEVQNFKNLLYAGKSNINEVSSIEPQQMLAAQAETMKVVSSVNLTSKIAGEVSQCVNKLTGMQ